MLREPLLLPFIAFAAGVYLGEALAFTMWEAALPALALLVLGMAPHRTRFPAILFSLVFAGAFSAAFHRPTREPWLDAAPREVVTITGCVVEPTVFSQDLAQFTLELEPGARARVQVPAYAEAADPPRLPYGQRVEVEARVRTPHNFGNPGAFDYAAYLARRDIYWTALVPASGAVRVLPGRCGSRFAEWIFGLRTAAIERIERLYPQNRYAAAMLEAVLIGESANLERVWTEDFRRSGTYHALVISGLHVSILAMVLLAMLWLTPVPREWALAITAIAAWLYALVSGFSTPVVRAAAGLTLYLIASLFFRRVRVLNLLSAIALAYLAFDPLQLFEASFHLSFLAVAAIGALAQPYLKRSASPLAFGMRDIGNTDIDPHLEPRVAQFRVELRLIAETIALWARIPQLWVSRALAWSMRGVLYVFGLGVTSLAIQIGLAVPMAIYFHRISFTGLTANLAIVPLMNAVVPAGFLALFTGWSGAASIADALLRWSASIAAWHANLEPAWRVPDPPLWLALAFAAALIAAAWGLRGRLPRWPMLALVAILLTLLVASPWPPQIVPGQLELTAIDVGQGDSLFVVFPEGATMLIDGGGRLSYGQQRARRPNLDIGEDVVSPYLWSRGIHRIDIVAITHDHQDHTGGLAALIENFRPREVWTGANPPRALREAFPWVRLVEKRAGAAETFSGASVQVLAPLEDYAAAQPGNNDSLVLRLSFGDRSFLLTGDLERPIENRLLAQGAPLEADVLKVGHHGSRTSTTQPFLDAISPSIALISAGFENSFGHPHPDVVDRLSANHTTILRTDLHGLVTIRTDGRRTWYEMASWTQYLQRRAFPVHLIN